MHALGSFIQAQMETRRWKQADLHRRSGLTRQHISDLLEPSRTRLGNMIQPTTVTGLARAFAVPESLIISKAVEAMGIPADWLPSVITIEPSDDELVEMIRRRLAERKTDEADLPEPALDALQSTTVMAPNPTHVVNGDAVSLGGWGRTGDPEDDSGRESDNAHADAGAPERTGPPKP